MSPQEKVKLARWFNARGIRMMKCAGHVESCGHYKAFRELAAAKFEERDRLIWVVRVELGKRKQFVFEVVDGFSVLADIPGFDELDAAERYERNGGPPFAGGYMMRKVGVASPALRILWSGL